MREKGRKEGNVLFNDALNTFYLRLYGVSHMVEDHSAREETRCCHMGYSFRLTTRVLLYASSHIQDNTVVEHWLEREIVMREKTNCFQFISYSFRIAARDLLYASSHRQVTHTTSFVTPDVKDWLE